MRLRLLVPALAIFALACGGAFEEGTLEAAADSLAEARTTVAACPDSPTRDTLNAALDLVKAGMDDGSMSGLNASMASGVIIGAAEDGCQPEDIEAVRTLYPSLVP